VARLSTTLSPVMFLAIKVQFILIEVVKAIPITSHVRVHRRTGSRRSSHAAVRK